MHDFVYIPSIEIKFVGNQLNKWEANVKTDSVLYLEGGNIFPTKV
jgi:hypothetical protein